MRVVALTAVLTLALATGARAQEPQPATAPPAAVATGPACCVVKADTPVEIELAQPVGSKISHIGDMFKIRLAAPIVVDGVTVVRAGALGEGEIIHASTGGMGGKSAKLILAGRYVTQDGVKIPLHALHLSGVGDNNTMTSLSAAFFVGALSLFIKGGEIELPEGAHAVAKTSGDVTVPPPASAVASSTATAQPQE